jgi:titin
MRSKEKFSLAFFSSGRLLSAMLAFNFVAVGRSATIPVTTTADSGGGSFRQALLTANTNPGVDTIVFQISGTPPFTITPATALPAITDPVVIDATTQPGFAGKPVIELSGTATSGGTIGLRFVVGASTLRGMAVNRFPIQAIELDSGSNTLQGNFVGTDVTGTLARGSGSTSGSILVKSAGNVIGGTNSGNGNVISGGNGHGIYLLNANSNLVQGNFIGVNASATAALGNANDGIVLYGSGGNLIGGATPAARNVISGNGSSGIFLTGTGTTGNVIQGNRIGTDNSGSNAISNVAGDGVTLIGVPGNVICSNLISANGLAGVSISGAGAAGNLLFGNFIGTDGNGKTSLGNHYAGVQIAGAGGNQIGGTNAGSGNVISGNVVDGIALSGGTMTNLIQGNVIGLSAAGTNALRNGQNGISISGSSSNIIGGVVAGARNVISGNSAYGIGILQLADSGNTVLGNYIGTDITGTKAISNALSGVQIQGCANTIGGTAAGAGNVISGNGQQGVWLSGTNGNVTGNVIQGNLIGLNATGTGRLGNANVGIGISGAANNLIGGTTAGARNVISANGNSATGFGGVFLAFAGTTGNQLLGNYIGTDVSGTVALGNVNDGITLLLSAATNFIGGSAAGAGNLISANGVDGIYLTNASWNVIQGNFIGTKADGTSALGNTFHNVELDVKATNNTIGGSLAGAGNRIAFAQNYTGVRVRDGSVNNLIGGNSIFSNGALGIDLGGYGVNSIYDCESGMSANAANAGQNFPTLSNVYCGTITRIRGTMDGKTGKTYTLQFFASPIGDSSGYGEGQLFLGQTNLTLGSSCSSNFTVYLPAPIPTGWVLTATATDASNNTSEFSAWVPVISVPSVQLTLLSSQSQLSIAWTNNGGTFALKQAYSLTPPIIWYAVTNIPVLTNHFWVTTLRMTNVFVSPVLLAKPSRSQLSLSWTNYGGSFALQQTHSLTPPINWSAASNLPVLTNNFWFTTLGTTNGNVFYRLAAPSMVFYRLTVP